MARQVGAISSTSTSSNVFSHPFLPYRESAQGFPCIHVGHKVDRAAAFVLSSIPDAHDGKSFGGEMRGGRENVELFVGD